MFTYLHQQYPIVHCYVLVMLVHHVPTLWLRGHINMSASATLRHIPVYLLYLTQIKRATKMKLICS